MQREGNPLLVPTYDEVVRADLSPMHMSWAHVLRTFAKESEIRPGKLNPDVRPVALLAGGRLTVRLRRHKGSHAPKGIVHVFRDARLEGYSARDAHVESHLRDWRVATHLRQRGGQAADLGFVGARRDASLPRPRPRRAPTTTRSRTRPRSAMAAQIRAAP